MKTKVNEETYAEKNYENAGLYLLEQQGYTRIDEPSNHEVIP